MIEIKDELKGWLVDATDEIRLEEIRFKKRAWLKSKSRHPNIHGYRFELEIWDFFLELKPKYISNLNHSAIFDLSKISNKNAPKINNEVIETYKEKPQTDIVVIFDRHIFIIECKATKDNLSHSKLMGRTRDVNGLRQYKDLRIRELFGDDVLIPLHMVCSKGFNSSNQDHKELLSKHQIILFSEKYRNYIDTVRKESQSPEFAYIQLLGFFRKDKPDYGTKTSIDSFHSKSGKNKKHDVFTFSISPDEMLKISTVSHQAKSLIFDEDDRSTEYYQRLLKKGRVKDISNWLSKNQNPFPNNILVSYRGASKLVWEKNPIKDNEKGMGKSVGVLKFDACPGTFHVIDGQHRLFSYTGIEKKPGSIRETHRLIVTVFDGMSPSEEADMFLEVNEKAQPISPALIMEIQYASQKVFLRNLANSIVFNLRDNINSSVYKKINRADGEGSRGGLSPKDLQTNILSMGFLGGELNYHKSYFWSKNSAKNWENLEECSKLASAHIISLLDIVMKKNESFWFKPSGAEKKAGKEGFLQNIVFGGLLGVIDRVTSVVTKSDRPDVENIYDACKQYFVTLANGIKNDDPKELALKTLNPGFYEKGASGAKQATAYMVYRYLSKKHPELIDKYDEAKLTLIGDPERSKEEMEVLDKWRKGLLKEISTYPKEVEKNIKNTRDIKGRRYHNMTKRLIQALFARKAHLNGDPWNALIVPNNLHKKVEYEMRIKGKTVKVKTGYKKDWTDYQNEVEKAGANYDGASAFDMIEGSDLSLLLSCPELIRNSVPKLSSAQSSAKKQIEDTIDFIYKNLLILPGDKKINKDAKPKDTDDVWKEGVKYIDTFYEFRNYGPGKSLDETHMPGINKLETLLASKKDLFDDYEKKFKEMLLNVHETLELDKDLFNEAMNS